MGKQCNYCLCRVCNKIRCPRGKFHCMPCYHGCVLECDFFLNKRVSKIYKIKRDQGEGDAYVLDKGTLKASLEAENQRHRRALQNIVKLYKSRE